MPCPTTTLTDTELRETYSNGTVPGILPSTSYGQVNRNTNGILNKSTVNSIIESLKQSGIIPNINTQLKSYFALSNKSV